MPIKQPLEVEVSGLAQNETTGEGAPEQKAIRLTKCVRLLKAGSYAIQVLFLYKSVIRHPLT